MQEFPTQLCFIYTSGTPTKLISTVIVRVSVKDRVKIRTGKLCQYSECIPVNLTKAALGTLAFPVHFNPTIDAKHMHLA